MKITAEFIGILATLVGVSRFVPIIKNVYITRKTNNFPYISLFAALISSLLWVVYGTFEATYANIIAGGVYFILYLFILIVKVISK